MAETVPADRLPKGALTAVNAQGRDNLPDARAATRVLAIEAHLGTKGPLRMESAPGTPSGRRVRTHQSPLQ
jgi:hypothetical protein